MNLILEPRQTLVEWLTDRKEIYTHLSTEKLVEYIMTGKNYE